MPVSLIIKNKIYDGTRLTIVGSQSGTRYYHYSEANGTRYYVNPISSTASPTLEAVTFDAYLSFTSSNSQTWDFTLIPMDTSNTCIVTTRVSGLKSDGSKGFLMNSFGGYRHSGSALTKIGGSFDYTYLSDFTGATAYFTASGTSSVNLVITGTSEVIDWDVYINYSKGFHTLSGGGGGGGVWYPDPPPPTE